MEEVLHPKEKENAVDGVESSSHVATSQTENQDTTVRGNVAPEVVILTDGVPLQQEISPVYRKFRLMVLLLMLTSSYHSCC